MKTILRSISLIITISITTVSLAQYDKIPPPSKTLEKLVIKQDKEANQLKLKQNDDKFQNLDKQASTREQLAKDAANRARALEAQQKNELAMAQTPAEKAKLALKHKAEKERLVKETNLKINTLEKNATKVNTALDNKQKAETNKLLTKQNAKLNKEANKAIKRSEINAQREAQGKSPLVRKKMSPERQAERKLEKANAKKLALPAPNKKAPIPKVKKAVKKKSAVKAKTKVRKRKGGN